MSILDRFLEGGEETIFRDSSRLVDIASKANKSLKTFVKTKKGIKTIGDIESEGDKEHFRLINIITTGAIAPNILDNMLQLADQEDGIIDCIYNLARELGRYKDNAKLSRIIDKSVLDNIELVDSALNVLAKMHNHDDLDKIRQMREVIANLEESGDEIKEALIDMAYDTKVDFKSFHHMIEVAHISDDILDGCQDASDTLLTILSSIIT